MTVNTDLIKKFLEAKYAEEGLSENSISAYSRDLKKISNKLNKPFLRITQPEIEKYFSYLQRLGFSSTTRARHLSSIKQFYKYLVEQGYLNCDPSSQLSGPRKPKPLPKTLTIEEVDALMEVAKTNGQNNFECSRNNCLMELLYASGMRISELMSLRVESVRGSPKNDFNKRKRW